MFQSLPKDATLALDWKAGDYEPFYKDLAGRALTDASVHQWLLDWSQVGRLASEVSARLNVATTVDTTDEQAEKRLTTFMDEVFPALMTFENTLNRKLAASGLQPPHFEIPLRKIQVEIELFREENLPLFAEQTRLSIEFDKVIGAQTVQWEGREVTLPQLSPVFLEHDRTKRERAWQLMSGRQLADRDALNDLWGRFLKLRGTIAANADFADYRAYQWRAMKRFDYTPEDARAFQDAIERVAVPAAKRIYDKYRRRLGVDTLRPWDVGGEPFHAGVDAAGRPPLKPYESLDTLVNTTDTIFNRVDPGLGSYFRTMRDEKLLDLDNRKGKAPGGYCTNFPVAQRPFIFMNAVGVHDDVQTLLHEGGHAFHNFESYPLPYFAQQDYPLEFAEVASMGMELLAAPYLAKNQGGFYSDADAARARVDHMETMIRFWPYMAVVDAFQHWVYTYPNDAASPAKCDAKWGELWDRFIQGIDYSGFEDTRVTGWHRKLHIFQVPFYYIEYGLAQLGAVQVWANALLDQADAVRQYRRALALGGTAGLPELFAAAGAKFGFDAGTLSGAVELLEFTINQLDPDPA